MKQNKIKDMLHSSVIRIPRNLFLLVSFLVAPALSLAATDYTAEITYPAKGTEKIENFELKQTRVPVRIKPKAGKEPELIIELEGSYSRKDWHLVWDAKQSSEAKSKSGFARRVELKGDDTMIDVIAVGPRGETQKAKLAIAFSSFETAKGRSKDKAYAFTPGMGVSMLSYQQTGQEDFSQIALTAKVAYRYTLPKAQAWSLGGTVYFTALPITTNQAVSARYIGLNFRAGYQLPSKLLPASLRNSMDVSLLFGGYYATMFVSEKKFGYENLMGPQIFPALNYQLPNGDRIGGYFKFSPVTDGLSMLSLSNNELALGAGWTTKLKSGNPVSVTLDLAKLKVTKDAKTVESTSVTLGGSYGF